MHRRNKQNAFVADAKLSELRKSIRITPFICGKRPITFDEK